MLPHKEANMVTGFLLKLNMHLKQYNLWPVFRELTRHTTEESDQPQGLFKGCCRLLRDGKRKCRRQIEKETLDSGQPGFRFINQKRKHWCGYFKILNWACTSAGKFSFKSPVTLHLDLDRGINEAWVRSVNLMSFKQTISKVKSPLSDQSQWSCDTRSMKHLSNILSNEEKNLTFRDKTLSIFGKNLPWNYMALLEVEITYNTHSRP